MHRPDPLSAPWPITLTHVRAAAERIAPFLERTPFRSYPTLDKAVGEAIRVAVKHENHQPTNAFKVRNAFAALTVLDDAQRRHGVITATRGNHGQGLAYAGQILDIAVTICVPRDNVADKNAAMKGFGAELIETGDDYDDAAAAAEALAVERNLTLVHPTNNCDVLAGAGTMTLEMLEQAPPFDAIVLAIGGGSQAVGALTVLKDLAPQVRVYGVQAEGARAIYDSWRLGRPVSAPHARTFADGLATRNAYALTFPTLQAGLAGFVAVTDAEIAAALRLLLATTHNLVEGAGAAGLAGLLKLRADLAGQRVAIVLSGGNIDEPTLLKVLRHEI